MSFIFEEIVDENLLNKAKYYGLSDFMWIKRNPESSTGKWYNTSYFIPSKYRQICQLIEDFEVRPDDVWVVSFPKCGTTWLQEMVWQIGNDLDFEKGMSMKLVKRFPFLEYEGVTTNKQELYFLDKVAGTLPSPRFIKTHLPASLLPKKIWTVKPKIIYIARNVKDVVVSFYHHYRNMQGYKGNFNDFCDAFLNDAVLFAPYDSHIADFWNIRHHDNILFLTYEEMQTDLPSIINKTANFLGKSLTNEQIKVLAEHLSFDKMAKNISVNFSEELEIYEKLMNRIKDVDYNFIRRGKASSYRDEMPSDLIEKFDKWIQMRVTKYENGELLQIFNGKSLNNL